MGWRQAILVAALVLGGCESAKLETGSGPLALSEAATRLFHHTYLPRDNKGYFIVSDDGISSAMTYCDEPDGLCGIDVVVTREIENCEERAQTRCYVLAKGAETVWDGPVTFAEMRSPEPPPAIARYEAPVPEPLPGSASAYNETTPEPEAPAPDAQPAQPVAEAPASAPAETPAQKIAMDFYACSLGIPALENKGSFRDDKERFDAIEFMRTRGLVADDCRAIRARESEHAGTERSLFTSFEDKDLCRIVVIGDDWSTDPERKAYVDEALRRGLRPGSCKLFLR